MRSERAAPPASPFLRSSADGLLLRLTRPSVASHRRSETAPAGKDSSSATGGSGDGLTKGSFVPLRNAHGDAWQRTREGHSRMPKLFGTIAVLNEMRQSGCAWEAAVSTLCTQNNLERSRLDEARIKALAPAAGQSSSEFCPTCAIVGGIAAQEIIKFVTGRGRPMDNQFYFDALDPKCKSTVNTKRRASG